MTKEKRADDRIRPLVEKDKDIYLNMLFTKDKEINEELHQLVRDSMWKHETDRKNKAAYMIEEEHTNN